MTDHFQQQNTPRNLHPVCPEQGGVSSFAVQKFLRFFRQKNVSVFAFSTV